MRYAIADEVCFACVRRSAAGSPPARRARLTLAREARDDEHGPSCVRKAGWPLERVLFAMAGTVVLASALLVALVSPWFLLLTAFVGVNQWLYVMVGACPASLVIRAPLRPALCAVPRRRARHVTASGRSGDWGARRRRTSGPSPSRGSSSPWASAFFAPRVETALSGAGWEATGSESVQARDAGRQELRRPLELRPAGRRALARQDGHRSVLQAGDRRRRADPAAKRRRQIRRPAACRRVDLAGRPHRLDQSRRGQGLQRRWCARRTTLKTSFRALGGDGVEVNLTGASGMWSDFNQANKSAMLKSEVISWPVTLGDPACSPSAPWSPPDCR